jgi:hypothetical protein
MDNKKVEKMANKIAGADDPLVSVDQAINSIIESIYVMDKNLSKIEINSPEEKAAVDKIQNLLDTAIAPYMADVAKEYLTFEDDE